MSPLPAFRLTTSQLRRGGLLLLIGLVFGLWLANTPAGWLGKADATAYAVCHRIDARSFHLGERSFPLCVRCSGMYLGAFVGLVFLEAAAPRRGGMPPKGLLALLGVLVLAFLVDGTNSFLSLIPGSPQLYPPNHILRWVTGSGMGLVLSVMVRVSFHQTAWRGWNPAPALAWERSLAILVGLLVLLGGLVWTESPLALYPLALVSSLSVWLILTLAYTTLILLISRRDNRAQSWRELWPYLAAGLGVALLQIATFDLLRYLLTGTWSGLPLG